VPEEKDLPTEQEAIRDLMKNPKHSQTIQNLLDEGRVLEVDGVPDDEPLSFVCTPWEDRSIAGCVKDLCADCSVEVALSPSSQGVIIMRKAKCIAICVECFRKRMVSD